MTHQPISTGLLSFGMSGRLFHAPFLNTHPGFTFSAVTERHQKKANQIYPHVKSYDSVDDLINDRELELVIVNTPNNTHADLARRVLLAGKYVLIEKPCGTSVAEVKELFQLGESLRLHVMAYQNRRWDSDFLSVKDIIESGRLGKIVEVHFRYDRYRPSIESKAFKEEPVPGSGLAYNLGPHLLDQVISLFGKPQEYYKTTTMNRDRSKVDDYVFFHLVYPDQVNVYVHASLLVARPLPAFVIHGTKGSFIKDRTDIQETQLDRGISPTDAEYGVELPGSEGELTIMGADLDKAVERISAPKGNYTRLFDAVYEQVRNGTGYPVTPEDIFCQMEMLEQHSQVFTR